MPIEAIICDWNVTLIDQPDERPILRYIALDLFQRSIPFHPLRAVRLLNTSKALEVLYRQKRQDGEFDYVPEMYRLYNKMVIKDLPVSLINQAVGNYAKKPATQARLDHRILRPVSERHKSGTPTGILSAAYKYGIRSILMRSEYSGCFGFIEANILGENGGKATGFHLDIYKNKDKYLSLLLNDKKLDSNKLAYIGDSEDDTGCLEIAGYPIVAFLAPDGLKRKFAEKYHAFVPADEEDLMKYLNRA